MVSELRQYDAAIMELGLEYTDKMAIPPGVLAFPLSGYCIAECTKMVDLIFIQQKVHDFRMDLNVISLTGSPTERHHYLWLTIAYSFAWSSSTNTTLSKWRRVA